MSEEILGRRLILLRHAKSSWKEPTESDHERRLNKRGVADAPRIAARLVELGWIPDFVASSDARRTQETWAHMSEVFPPIDTLFTRRLYHGNLEAIRDVVTEVPSTARTVMFIGHNPGWEEAVHELTGTSEAMTTCNAALLTSHRDDWNDALRGQWNLVHVVRPKEL